MNTAQVSINLETPPPPKIVVKCQIKFTFTSKCSKRSVLAAENGTKAVKVNDLTVPDAKQPESTLRQKKKKKARKHTVWVNTQDADTQCLSERRRWKAGAVGLTCSLRTESRCRVASWRRFERARVKFNVLSECSKNEYKQHAKSEHNHAETISGKISLRTHSH